MEQSFQLRESGNVANGLWLVSYPGIDSFGETDPHMNWPGKLCFSFQRTKVHWSPERLDLQGEKISNKQTNRKPTNQLTNQPKPNKKTNQIKQNTRNPESKQNKKPG